MGMYITKYDNAYDKTIDSINGLIKRYKCSSKEYNIIDYDNIKCIKNVIDDLDHKSYFIYYNNSDYVFLTYVDSGNYIETLKIHNFNSDRLYNHGYGYATIYYYYTYTDGIKRKEEDCVEYYYYKDDMDITDIYVKNENRKRILEKI